MEQSELNSVKGNLERLNLANGLLSIFLQKLSGFLNVIQDDVSKKFFFINGNLVFAASNQLEDRLGDILLDDHKITQAQYDESVEELKKGKYRQGAILIKLGYMTTHDLILAIRHQIKTILYSVLPWQKGYFVFEHQREPIKESVTLRENNLQLLQKAMESVTDRAWFLHGISSLTMSLKINPANQELAMRISLTPYERKIFDFVAEGEKSIEELCDWSDHDEIETIKALSYILEKDLLAINDPYWQGRVV